MGKSEKPLALYLKNLCKDKQIISLHQIIPIFYGSSSILMHLLFSCAIVFFPVCSVQVEAVPATINRINNITADPDDNKFVDCAIQANARYIVTNDHHYDILRQIDFPKVEIIKLMDFLLMIHG